MSFSPLDLPQVWQKPDFTSLITALYGLRDKPTSWDHSSNFASDEDQVIVNPVEVSNYLNNIIKSPLSWFTDSEREQIWEEASERIAERCGRSGMGEMIRSWKLDALDGEIVIREPPLVGDNTGFKTWGAAYQLAQRLTLLGRQWLRLESLDVGDQDKALILELGSGTGLLGIAAACLWQTSVVLSDLPDIIPNLQRNLERNSKLLDRQRARVQSGELRWGELAEDASLFSPLHKYKVILAADVLYDDHQPELLASAVHEQLSLDADAVAFVCGPGRDDAASRLKSEFTNFLMLKDPPIKCIATEKLHGLDDWGKDNEDTPIEFWLGIFRRQDRKL